MAVAALKMDRFLDWLMTDQERSGETDRVYAQRRKLSYSHYSNAKARRRTLSRPMVERMCQEGTDDVRNAYIALCLTNYGPAAEAELDVPPLPN